MAVDARGHVHVQHDLLGRMDAMVLLAELEQPTFLSSSSSSGPAVTYHGIPFVEGGKSGVMHDGLPSSVSSIDKGVNDGPIVTSVFACGRNFEDYSEESAVGEVDAG